MEMGGLMRRAKGSMSILQKCRLEGSRRLHNSKLGG